MDRKATPRLDNGSQLAPQQPYCLFTLNISLPTGYLDLTNKTKNKTKQNKKQKQNKKKRKKQQQQQQQQKTIQVYLKYSVCQ